MKNREKLDFIRCDIIDNLCIGVRKIPPFLRIFRKIDFLEQTQVFNDCDALLYHGHGIRGFL